MSDALKDALALTGLATVEELIDMAKTGSSLMVAIETYIQPPNLLEGWSRNDDAADIIRDLYNRFEESIACHKADLERLRAAEAALAAKQAIEDALAERQRQIEAEGWTPEHDDREHSGGQLAIAAACYAISAGTHDGNRHLLKFPSRWDFYRGNTVVSAVYSLWSLTIKWSSDWWKPTDRRRDLIKAGALIIAEIERLDRAAAKAEGPPSEASAKEEG